MKLKDLIYISWRRSVIATQFAQSPFLGKSVLEKQKEYIHNMDTTMKMVCQLGRNYPSMHQRGFHYNCNSMPSTCSWNHHTKYQEAAMGCAFQGCCAAQCVQLYDREGKIILWVKCYSCWLQHQCSKTTLIFKNYTDGQKEILAHFSEISSELSPITLKIWLFWLQS